MKKIPLGTTDITLSRMGLGTWAIGGGPAWNGDLDRQICSDTILEAHRCGINLIDTAPGYNFGNSEVIVGQALKKLPREQVVVETKCGIVWERKGSLFNKVGDRQLYKNLSPESIREEVAASLQRLGIDYIASVHAPGRHTNQIIVVHGPTEEGPKLDPRPIQVACRECISHGPFGP